MDIAPLDAKARAFIASLSVAALRDVRTLCRAGVVDEGANERAAAHAAFEGWLRGRYSPATAAAYAAAVHHAGTGATATRARALLIRFRAEQGDPEAIELIAALRAFLALGVATVALAKLTWADVEEGRMRVPGTKGTYYPHAPPADALAFLRKRAGASPWLFAEATDAPSGFTAAMIRMIAGGAP